MLGLFEGRKTFRVDCFGMCIQTTMAAVSFSPSLRPLVASTSRISSTSSRSFHVTPHARSVEAYARIRPAATHRSRYLAHYQNTLAPDLLYMTYDHQNTQRPPEPPALPSWDSENPHTKNRSRPRIKTALTPAPRPTTDRNLIQIESLTLSIHVKQAAGEASTSVTISEIHQAAHFTLSSS